MKLLKKTDQPDVIESPGGERLQEILGLVAGKISSHSLAQVVIQSGNASALHYHKHSEESYFILAGEANLIINNQSFKLVPGEAVLIEPHDIHQISNHKDQDLEFIAVCVPAWSPDDSFEVNKTE
jgi:mannose-6-phosphate isomerase-like protein (cupin superfamily)